MLTSIWKVAKWMAIGTTALIAVLAMAFAWWYWRAEVELERRIAAIRGAGLPATLADLATEAVAPEKNALTYLRRARADALAIEAELASMGEKIAEEKDLSEAELKQIEVTFSAFPAVLPLIERAANCAEYRSGADFAMKPQDFLADELESLGLSRSIARVLDKHIALLISKTQLDDAARDALTLVRIGRHTENEGTITGFLTSIAVRGVALGRLADILQRGEVTQEIRRRVEDELARDNDGSAFQRAIISERAFGNSSFLEFPWPMKQTYQCQYLDLMQTQIENADRPYNEPMSSAKTRQSRSLFSPFFAQIAPAIEAAREANARTLALARAIRVLNCIQSSPELAQSDRIELSALSLPKDATVDPFTGQPLIVRKTIFGWQVYSVGRDLKDDGGKTETHGDIGTSPRQ